MLIVLSKGNNWPDYLGNVTYALTHQINLSIIGLYSMRTDNGINKESSQCFTYLERLLH